jgi:preprotein translocase subunit SecG
MSLFLTVVHVLVCLFLIVVVLLQRGKGADIGAVFGSGSGATLFGSRGAGNFLTRLTTGAAVVFMLTSLSLAYFAQEGARSTLLEDDAPAAGEPASPFAEPGATAPPAPEGAPAGGGFEQVPQPVAPPPEGAQPEAAKPEAAPPVEREAAPEAPPAQAPATP